MVSRMLPVELATPRPAVMRLYVTMKLCTWRFRTAGGCVLAVHERWIEAVFNRS